MLGSQNTIAQQQIASIPSVLTLPSLNLGLIIQNQIPSKANRTAQNWMPYRYHSCHLDIGSEPGSVGVKLGPKIHDNQIKSSQTIKMAPTQAQNTTGDVFWPEIAFVLLPGSELDSEIDIVITPTSIKLFNYLMGAESDRPLIHKTTGRQ